MKKNLTIILSNIFKAVAHEWTIELLNREKFNISFILMNPRDSEMEEYLRVNKIKYLRINYHGKKDLPKSIVSIFKFLLKNKTNVLHAHLFEANLAGMIAGKFAGVRKRIYTRHHSIYHHRFFPKAVKYDKLVSYLATDIIAISKNVQHILIDLEQVNPKKIHLIHHGFRFEDFDKLTNERIETLRNKYSAKNKYPVIGVISRYTWWKGVQNIIPAFKHLLQDYPDAFLILANAGGDFKSEIKKLLAEIPQRNYLEIEFENDFIALYKLFDVFVHVPVDGQSEAFGQTYIESLASGIPSVFTISGIACEFIEHRQNAWVAAYENENGIYTGIKSLLDDKILKERIKDNGKKDVRKLFALEKMVRGFEEIYLAD
ncbi:MAG: glycosyltransferase family 4 protein [Bacteroidia bacterium]